MSEEHRCCLQGLCAEAAGNQTHYWSELARPYLAVKAKLKIDKHTSRLWVFYFGELNGYGNSPAEAANDFDKKWNEKL